MKRPLKLGLAFKVIVILTLGLSATGSAEIWLEKLEAWEREVKQERTVQLIVAPKLQAQHPDVISVDFDTARLSPGIVSQLVAVRMAQAKAIEAKAIPLVLERPNYEKVCASGSSSTLCQKFEINHATPTQFTVPDSDVRSPADNIVGKP